MQAVAEPRCPFGLEKRMNQISRQSPLPSTPSLEERNRISCEKITNELKAALVIMEDGEPLTVSRLRMVQTHCSDAQRENFSTRLRMMHPSSVASVFEQVREARA